jgi:hypothetical protein
MAGKKGQSGPPGNANAFRHGLAALQNRRADGELTDHEQDIRAGILAGLIADKVGEQQIGTAERTTLPELGDHLEATLRFSLFLRAGQRCTCRHGTNYSGLSEREPRGVPYRARDRPAGPCSMPASHSPTPVCSEDGVDSTRTRDPTPPSVAYRNQQRYPCRTGPTRDQLDYDHR